MFKMPLAKYLKYNVWFMHLAELAENTAT